MIPLKDDIPSARFPAVNTALIVVSSLVFLFEAGLGGGLGPFVYRHGVVPSRLLSHGFADWGTILTSMFLHGGWAHVIGNMLYLYIFGDNIEDAMGHVRYLLFYLLCGFGASWAHVLAGPGSAVPTIGASGAIAGVLGAYLILYPRAGVLTLIPLGFFFRIVRVPAVVVLGFWIVLQIILGLISLPLAGGARGGTAWFAHIGGFVAGVAMVKLFAGRSARRAARYNPV
ncbi:MAG: rhomboid family intramembrane serine protease [Candidatus Edwardsbacteria bacterium]|nr:rhomboid family intramembrane serine protease [Candidatus Edwardsbacteria bacterium]